MREQAPSACEQADRKSQDAARREAAEAWRAGARRARLDRAGMAEGVRRRRPVDRWSSSSSTRRWRYGAARRCVGGIGVGMLGPTLIVHGTEEQKQRAPARASSAARASGARATREPGAGSDLASLQTRAVRDGDDYVINGQKIWTSRRAHSADWMFLLARTDPDAPKHRGITLPAWST